MLGLKTAPVVVMVLLIAGTAVLAMLLGVVLAGAVHPTWYGVLVAVLLPGIWALQRFRSAPSASAVKTCEGMVALAMLAGYVVLLAAIWLDRGLTCGCT